MPLPLNTSNEILVIGSGYSGLTSALELHRLGYSVRVVEKLSAVGGRAQQLRVDNISFDIGPSWYWMHSVFEDVFRRFGSNYALFYNISRLNPAYEFVTPSNAYSIPGENFNAWAIDTFKEERGLEVFLEEARAKFSIAMRWMWKPMQKWTDFVSTDVGWLFSYDVFNHLETHIAKLIENPTLRTLLTWPTIFLGVSPKTAMAFYSFMSHAGHEEGTFYPTGGMSAPAKGLYELALQRGIKFNFESAITYVHCHEGKIVAACSEAECWNTSGAVVTSDYAYFEQTILPLRYRRYTPTYWNTRILSPSCLLLLLTADEYLPTLHHHTLFVNDQTEHLFDKTLFNPHNASFYVSAPSRTDASLLPSSSEAKDFLFVLIPFPFDIEDVDVESLLKFVATRINEHTGATATFSCIRFIKQTNFTDIYNAFRGNAFGLANTVDQSLLFKPSITSKLNNLMFAGHMTHPGPGVPPALISGIIAANLLHQKIRETEPLYKILLGVALSVVLVYTLRIAYTLGKMPYRVRYPMWMCLHILQRGGKTYFIGALTLSWDRLFLTGALYAFMRVVDDIVDSHQPSVIRKVRLKTMISEFYHMIETNTIHHDLLSATESCAITSCVYAIRILDIDVRIYDRFFCAMDGDAQETNIMETMDHTMSYMDGSASTVADIMLYILEAPHHSECVRAARSLSLAFQMTNFIRDIAEDASLQRQYIPQDICNQKDVPVLSKQNPNTCHVIEHMLRINDEWYAHAEGGIRFIPSKNAWAIRASLRLYRQIDYEIRRKNYNVWDRRISISAFSKLWIFSQTCPMKVTIQSCFTWAFLCGAFLLGEHGIILHSLASALFIHRYAVPLHNPTYWTFHEVFSILPMILSTYTAFAQYSSKDFCILGVIVFISTFYTLPWDSLMISMKVWEYPLEYKTFLHVPYGEILFFNIVVVSTFMVWKQYNVDTRLVRLGVTKRSASNSLRLLMVGALAFFTSLRGPAKLFYLASIFSWVCVPISIQVLFGTSVLCATMNRWLPVSIAASLYLLVAESWALRYNIWMINTTIGEVFGIPIEEAIFYILAVFMSTWGFELCSVGMRHLPPLKHD